MNIDRSGFLYTLGAGAFMPGRAPLTRGLVLSGGGAKGAYEAGVIATLADQTPESACRGTAASQARPSAA